MPRQRISLLSVGLAITLAVLTGAPSGPGHGTESSPRPTDAGAAVGTPVEGGFSATRNVGAGIPRDAAPVADCGPIAAMRCASPAISLGSSYPASQWVNLTGATGSPSPPYETLTSSAPYANGSEMVLFGGNRVDPWYASENPTNTTWIFSAGRWSNVTDPSDAPPASFSGLMDYDPNFGGDVLFGGQDTPWGNNTWLFRDGAWTNVSRTVGNGPPGSAFAAMAFDANRSVNATIFFAANYNFHETWSLTPAGWKELSASGGPSLLLSPSLAYDAASRQLVLFGGAVSAGDDVATTYLLSASGWRNVSSAACVSACPPPREVADMAYSSSLGGLLLFGGRNASANAALNDSWLYKDGLWGSLATTATPPGAFGATMGSIENGSVALLYGGATTNGPTTNQSWAFESAPNLTARASATSVDVGVTVGFNASVNGAWPPVTLRWEFGDSTGASGAEASHAYSAPGVYDTNVTATDPAGLASTISLAIAVHALPRANLSASPAAHAGTNVTLSATVSGGTSPFQYLWSFGDGTTRSTGTGRVAHVYAAAGTYTANVTVVDADGASSSANVSVVVSVAPQYRITFEEAGLSPGTNWTIALGPLFGGPFSTNASTTSEIGFVGPSGNYTFWVEYVVGYAADPMTGSFAVNGSEVNVSVGFTPVPLYLLAFQEKGLVAGAAWYVDLDAGSGAASGWSENLSSTTTTVNFTVPDGDYGYFLGSPNGTPTPASGTEVVNGTGRTVGVLFVPSGPAAAPTYPVTFSETGLPAGTNWTITVHGEASYLVEGVRIVLQESNGSHAYAIGAPAGYAATPSSGAFDVDGSPVNVSVAFSSVPSNGRSGSTTAPTTSLGLPGLEGYALLAVLAAGIAGGALALWLRRRGGGAATEGELPSPSDPPTDEPPP